VVTAPQLGDFALTKIGGITGKFVALGQALIGDAAPVQHAFVYVGGGYIVQAMPGGAEMIRLEDASTPVIWSTGYLDLSQARRRAIANEAINLVGTPYSFVDYASIALATFHIRPRVVRDYIADTGHMICSQLVDEVYARGGVQLFDDGRLPGDVTPGDLWHVLQRPREARAEAARVDVREAA
jgi:cell wall-associated NlpC family hydrolase